MIKLFLFGIPSEKDSLGQSSLSNDAIVPKAVRLIKSHYPDVLVIADLCFCEYTDHGQCGVLKEGMLDDHKTCALLAKQAVFLAESGVDVIAPSGMIDGMVLEIRSGLRSAGFDIPIMSYAVKFSSTFYGPFRDAAGSVSVSRAHHQMSFDRTYESLREAGSDIEQGADMLLVKPAHTYLDVICRI